MRISRSAAACFAKAARSTACRQPNGSPRTLAELAALPDVRIMPRTTVFGVYDGGIFGAVERVSDHLPLPPEHQPRQRLWRIVAKRCIVAAGAIERPIVFGGNDMPGVMMASAMRTYVKRYAAAPGKRSRCSPTMMMAGARSRPRLAPGCRSRPSSMRGRTYRPPIARRRPRSVSRCCTARSAASMAARTASARLRCRSTGGARAEVEADGLAVSGGWSPTVGLTSYHRGRPKWRDDIAAFVPDGAPPGMVAVGAANGAFGLGACLREGFAAGATAAADSRPQRQCRRAARRRRRSLLAHAALACRRQGKGLRRLPERCDGLRHRSARSAKALRSVEHLKRYTTLGMATDQGKTSNVNGLAIMAAVTRQVHPRDRHDDLPAALRAGRHRRVRRPSPRRAFPADAADALA